LDFEDSPGAQISGMDHETMSVWFQRRKAAGIGVFFFDEFEHWPMPGVAGTGEAINIATQTRPDPWLHAAEDR
jgi:hypothetical protein